MNLKIRTVDFNVKLLLNPFIFPSRKFFIYDF